MSGMPSRFAALVPRPYGFIHLAWALLILASCVVLVMMGGAAELRRWPMELVLIAAVPALHTAAFVLLLLRISVARFLLAAIACGWGLTLLLQMREARGPGEWVLGVVLITALAGIAA